MSRNSVGVLASGGLDSDVLLAQMAAQYRQVWPIYIRQGLAWENTELYWLKRFISRCVPAANVHVLLLPMDDLYGRHWSTGKKPVPGAKSPDKAVYLPGRNLALTVKAAIFCAERGIHDLAIGSLGHNPFPDAAPAFFQKWGNALSQGLAHRLRILAPFRQKFKAALIRSGKDLPLHLSFSCIAPKGKRHCGHCNKCAERRRAFKVAGVTDRTVYAKS